ncbi:MAG: hypothetical protein CVU20_11110 [Betaproteobacteria bacterium HGW-Betaproteobacteria-14]|nr:MAG: hypothetical protein CVU20_11110 [Betaproteobacteria bacterium HGW-Betaproteobacteria-14]
MWLTGCASVADAGRLAELEVLSSTTGQVLQSWRHGGRLYVAGSPGERYAVRLVNRSSGRLLAVLSVDGVNVVTGETAAVRQSGYVLRPWRTADIRGWRKSLDDVAAFYFTALPDSYAARSNRPDNVGVIGVALYREHVAPRAELMIEGARSSQAPAAPRAAASEAQGDARMKQESERLGTGHGERMHDATRYTDFRRASEAPAEVLTIHYDSRENLMARGIIPRPPRHGQPQPFPGGFVPDPEPS